MTANIMMAIPYKLIKRSKAILSPLTISIIVTKKSATKGLFLIRNVTISKGGLLYYFNSASSFAFVFGP